jgi:hypothetical protein
LWSNESTEARTTKVPNTGMGSNPDISQKYKMGDISKGVANTLLPARKYTKNSGMEISKT